MKITALVTRHVPGYPLFEQGSTRSDFPRKVAESLIAQGYAEKAVTPRKAVEQEPEA